MVGEVQFQPTETHYVAANKDWFRLSLRTPRARKRRLQIIAVLALCGGVLGYVEGGIWQAAISALFIPAGSTLLIAMIVGGTYLLLPRRAGRLYRQQQTMHQPFRYVWTDEGITLHTRTSKGCYAWGQVYSWAEGRSAVLIFFNEQMFYFLPLQVLGPEAAADLRSTLERSGVARA